MVIVKPGKNAMGFVMHTEYVGNLFNVSERLLVPLLPWFSYKSTHTDWFLSESTACNI